MNLQFLREWLPRLAGQRILVLGDVMLDEFVWGAVRRISPEAPVPIVEWERHSSVPGGAGNVAANAATLGCQVVLGGVIGDDNAGINLRSALESRLIDVSGLIVDKARPTTTKTRVIAHQQHVLRLDRETIVPLEREDEKRLLEWALAQIDTVDACVLSDYAKGVVSESLSRTLIDACRRSAKKIIVDPKGNDFTKYRGASVLKPNLSEASLALKIAIADEVSLADAGRRLSTLLDGAAVVITRGAQGIYYFEGNSGRSVPAACRQQVFDVTGAGDTVAAALAVALAAGLSLEEGVQMANLAAGIAVAKGGTASVTLEDLLQETNDGLATEYT